MKMKDSIGYMRTMSRHRPLVYGDRQLRRKFVFARNPRQ